MINLTEIQNITTQEQFINLAHNSVAMPSLIILYITFILAVFVAGLITLKGSLTAKFWALFGLSIVLSGGMLLALYLLPNFTQNVWNFIF